MPALMRLGQYRRLGSRFAGQWTHPFGDMAQRLLETALGTRAVLGDYTHKVISPELVSAPITIRVVAGR